MVVEGACHVLWALTSVNSSVYSAPYTRWQQLMPLCFWACAPSSACPSSSSSSSCSSPSARLTHADLPAQHSTLDSGNPSPKEATEVTGEDESDAWGAFGMGVGGEGYSNVFSDPEIQMPGHAAFDKSEPRQVSIYLSIYRLID
jgi:hypothetical protein